MYISKAIMEIVEKTGWTPALQLHTIYVIIIISCTIFKKYDIAMKSQNNTCVYHLKPLADNKYLGNPILSIGSDIC